MRLCVGSACVTVLCALLTLALQVRYTANGKGLVLYIGPLRVIGECLIMASMGSFVSRCVASTGHGT